MFCINCDSFHFRTLLKYVCNYRLQKGWSGLFSFNEGIINLSQKSAFNSAFFFGILCSPSTGQICAFAEDMCDAVGTGRTIPSVPHWPCQGTDTLHCVYTIKSINLNKPFNAAFSKSFCLVENGCKVNKWIRWFRLVPLVINFLQQQFLILVQFLLVVEYN